MDASSPAEPDNAARRAIANEHNGDLTFPIWLLGDSPPDNKEGKFGSGERLRYPLDPRYPTRHNIWTPVLDQIQERVFTHARRLDAERCYLRNAFPSVPVRDTCRGVAWPEAGVKAVREYASRLKEQKPRMVITFGAAAFELARRASNHAFVGEPDYAAYPPHNVPHWSIARLSSAFDAAVDHFCLDKLGPAIIPLLHIVISQGNCLRNHDLWLKGRWSDRNYFTYAGSRIAEALLAHGRHLPIWRVVRAETVTPQGSLTEVHGGE